MAREEEESPGRTMTDPTPCSPHPTDQHTLRSVPELLQQLVVKLALIDNRLARLETRVGHLEQRFGHLEQRLGHLETYVYTGHHPQGSPQQAYFGYIGYTTPHVCLLKSTPPDSSLSGFEAAAQSFFIFRARGQYADENTQRLEDYLERLTKTTTPPLPPYFHK
jgi:hypothetical protein